MSKILGLLSGNVGLYAAVILALALIGFGAVQTVRLGSAVLTISKLEVDAARSVARAATMTKQASEDARKVEAQRAIDAAENVKELNREKSESAARYAAFAAESAAGFDSLRKHIAAFAGRAGVPTTGAGAGLSPGNRAAALGRALVAAEAATRAAEQADSERIGRLEAQVRGLLRDRASLGKADHWGSQGDHP